MLFPQHIYLVTIAGAHAFIHELFTTITYTLCFLPMAWYNLPDPVRSLHGLASLTR